MEENKYLINYYKNNNIALDHITLKRRFITRFLILLICAICYYLMSVFSKFSKFKGEITLFSAITIFKIVMGLALIVSIIGLILWTIKMICDTKQYELKFKLSYKIKKIFFTIIDWFTILPICIVITVFCFSYLFIITPVSGDSMLPNIENGEHVFVSYNEKIDRGKVVILEVNPTDNFDVTDEKYYIKRIIGLPGDKVTWTLSENSRKGILKINDEVYEEKYFENGADCSRNAFLGEFKYKIKEEDKVLEKTTYVIPDGYYFVMGDNRSNSHDSRDIGLIPATNIIGVAKYHMNFIIPRGKI